GAASRYDQTGDDGAHRCEGRKTGRRRRRAQPLPTMTNPLLPPTGGGGGFHFSIHPSLGGLRMENGIAPPSAIRLSELSFLTGRNYIDKIRNDFNWETPFPCKEGNDDQVAGCFREWKSSCWVRWVSALWEFL